MEKTKFLKRKALLLLIIFITFWSCQKDDFYENQTSVQQSTDVTFKRISYKHLKTNQKAMEKLGKFTLRNNLEQNNPNNNILQRTVYNEQLGIEIDTIGIVYIEKDGYHTITLQAYQGDENDGKLKNLVLNQEKDGSYSEYLLVYDLSDEELEKVENKENVDLIGNTTIYAVTSNYNPSGFPLNDPDCWEDIVIGQVAVPCASGLHMPGQVCDYAGGPGAAYVKDVTIKVISAGCGMGGGGGGGSTGGSPGTGGGGSGGEANPGTGSNPSNPNNPSNPGNTVNPQEPGFADQDGNPISTTPVKNPELLELEDEQDEDCEQLNGLKNKSGFTSRMNTLKNNLTGTKEKGFIIRDVPNDEFSNVVDGDSNGNIPYPFESQTQEQLYKTYGTAHNHLQNNPKHVGIFTPEDLGPLFLTGSILTHSDNPYQQETADKAITFVITNKGFFRLKLKI